MDGNHAYLPVPLNEDRAPAVSTRRRQLVSKANVVQQNLVKALFAHSFEPGLAAVAVRPSVAVEIKLLVLCLVVVGEPEVFVPFYLLAQLHEGEIEFDLVGLFEFLGKLVLNNGSPIGVLAAEARVSW